MMRVNIELRDERERLIVEQALLAYREVESAGASAAYGQGMAVLEDAALEAGRRQMRGMIEQTLGSRAEAQKGGRGIPGAGATRPSSGRRPRLTSAALGT